MDNEEGIRRREREMQTFEQSLLARQEALSAQERNLAQASKINRTTDPVNVQANMANELTALRAQNADLVSQIAAAHIIGLMEEVARLRAASNKPPAQVTDPTTHLQLGAVLSHAAECQGQWLASAAACTVAAQIANSQKLDLRTRIDALASAGRGAAAAAAAYQRELQHMQRLCATLGGLLVEAYRSKELQGECLRDQPFPNSSLQHQVRKLEAFTRDLVR